MGLETLNSNYSILDTKTLGCLICSKWVPRDVQKGKGQENVFELFQVLCKYMKWEPPLKYCFNFDTDDFPFCEDCKSSVVSLHDHNQLILKVQQQIERTTARLSAQILESENEKDKVLTVDFSQNNFDQSLTPNGVVDIYRKILYYRNATKRRYSTSVRLIVDPNLRNCQQNIENEHMGQNPRVSLVFKDEVDVEQIIPADFEASVDEPYFVENVESILRELELDETEVNDGFVALEVEIDNSKQISEAPTLKQLDQEEEDEEDTLRKFCDDSEAVGIFMDESQNEDCDYSPDISSDDDGEEIVQDQENKRKSAARRKNVDALTRYFRKCQYGDRVRFLGKEDSNLKFLFDDSFPFELNSEGKWTCYTCKFSYLEKRKLLVHLSNICNGQFRKQIVRTTKTVDTEMATDIFEEKTVTDLLNSLKHRVKKIGDSKFLLDDKCRFECAKLKWRCISCDLTFRTINVLRYHLNYCPGDPSADASETYKFKGCIYDKLICGKFQCRHCRISCASDGAMVHHLKKFHVGRLKFKRMPLCVEVEPNKYLCNEKFPFEFVDENFKCGTCFANFSARSEIELHVQKVHLFPSLKQKLIFTNPSPGKFMAEGFSFEKVGEEYRCDHCTYSCPNLSTIKDHLRRSHIYVKKIPCQTCGKKFNCRKDLQRHLKLHKNDRPCICELCGKSFKLICSLRSHTALVHPESADKKFSCEVCGQIYGSRSLLRVHLKRHEVSVCHLCGKEMKNSRLNYHLARHKEENECKLCGKKYLHKNSLIVHEKSHEGIKPYSCDICNAKFNQKHNLVRHKARCHNPNTIGVNKKTRKSKLRNRSNDNEETKLSGTEDER